MFEYEKDLEYKSNDFSDLLNPEKVKDKDFLSFVKVSEEEVIENRNNWDLYEQKRAEKESEYRINTPGGVITTKERFLLLNPGVSEENVKSNAVFMDYTSDMHFLLNQDLFGTEKTPSLDDNSFYVNDKLILFGGIVSSMILVYLVILFIIG